MRIGTIYTIYNGKTGIEFSFERIVKEILKIGKNIKFTVFCNQNAFEVLKKENHLDLFLVKALNNQYTKALWLESFSKKYINKRNIDLFWVPSGTNHFPGRWDIPVVTTIHDIGECHIKNKYGFIRNFYRKIVCIPRSLKRSKSIIAVSNFTAADIAGTLKYHNKIKVIYQAPEPWKEEGTESSVDAIGQEKGRNFEKIILCVGRIFFVGKGIDVILKGYRDLLGRSPGCLLPLVFVGPPGEKTLLLEKFIKKFRLQENIFYLGPVSNNCLESLYRRAVVTIIASRYEGFGMVVLESMKRRIPVLCSDLEVIREISGNAPVFFNPGDPLDFAQKLSDILSGSIDLRINTELGFNISSRYSWERTAEEYLDVFRSLGKSL